MKSKIKEKEISYCAYLSYIGEKGLEYLFYKDLFKFFLIILLIKGNKKVIKNRK